MRDALFDTNILVDALSGAAAARAELQRVRRPWITRVTWVEVMAGAPEAAASGTEAFLGRFSISELTDEIARRAAVIQRDRRLKLPDAILWATAQVSGRILVTRNIKDFPAVMPGIRIPYQL